MGLTEVPTRAEAEYASRAGTISTFYSGDIAVQELNCQPQPNLEPIAWYCNNSGERVHVGGEKEPNGFGLYDTLGNVREWTMDAGRISTPPGDEDPDATLTEGKERLVFGGRYNSFGFILRAANLSAFPADSRGYSIGIRLARKAP